MTILRAFCEPCRTGVAYELVYLRTGEKAIVNRRNFRPFYEDKFDEDKVFPVARTTQLPVAPINN